MKEHPIKFVPVDEFKKVVHDCIEYQRRYEVLENMIDKLNYSIIKNLRSSNKVGIRDIDNIVLACTEFNERLIKFYQSCKDYDKENEK